MPTMARKGLPEVWPSGVASLLVGESSCAYAPWFKAHFMRFDKMPNSFDFAAWKVEHTALLNITVKRLEKDGWTCKVEDQNRFRLTGTTCVLVGKPDIVARKDKKIRVVDCKTGQQNDAHGVQVAIYQVALPLAWERPNLYVEGEVAYKGASTFIEPQEAQAMKARIFAVLRQMGSSERPSATPSEKGCQYCEITEGDCPDRYKDRLEQILTSEF